MTMRSEEYLRGILGALGVGEDAGVPEPVWRHEAYLKAFYEAIKAGVPNAKQLMATVGTTDRVPYIFRTSGGSADIGETAVEKLVGGTLVWNQLVGEDDASVTVPSGHKYVSCIDGAWTVATSNGAAITVDGSGGDMVFDLSQMFGVAIASHVYALEQATTGAGVSWFRKLFPKTSYAYDAGTLLSVRCSAHTMVGFNAYDAESGTAKVVGGMQYEIVGDYTALSLDGEAIAPDENGKFTPASSGTLTITGGSAASTCVHLVWDGERDGAFEPYEKHTYALDSDLTLLGVPKLDGNDRLYYDGDTYASDGTVMRKYAMLDLGTLSWSNWTQSGHKIFYAQMPLRKQVRSSLCVAPGYVYNATLAISWDGLADMTFTGSDDNKIYFRNDACEETADFASAVDGVYCVYELAAPTAETAAPYDDPQWVNDFGTEEYEAPEQGGVIVPVGHETLYKTNLRAKLEMAPDSPSDDGDYLVRHADGQNVYVPRSEVIPDLPSANGTYRLQVTVSGSTKTLSWTAV